MDFTTFFYHTNLLNSIFCELEEVPHIYVYMSFIFMYIYSESRIIVTGQGQKFLILNFHYHLMIIMIKQEHKLSLFIIYFTILISVSTQVDIIHRVKDQLNCIQWLFRNIYNNTCFENDKMLLEYNAGFMQFDG